jgi:general bacterial porin, GBP family
MQRKRINCLYRSLMTGSTRAALINTSVILAILASATVSASSTVTLYGVIDLGLYYNTVSRQANALGPAVNETLSGMASGVQSGSRWGIKATEKISTDWSVNVVLESGINAQDGTLGQGGLGFGRQSTLSLLSRQYGSLTFGRRGAMAYTYLASIDPFAVSGSQAGMGSSFGSANGVRPNNLLLYETPKLNGWQASLGYSFNTGFTALYYDGPGSNTQSATQYFGSRSNMQMVTAGVNHESGPLSFFLAYEAVYGASKVTDPAGQVQTNTNNAVPRAWMIGGTYDLALVKLSAVIGQTINGTFFGQGAGAGGYTPPLTTFSDGADLVFAKGVRSLQYGLGVSVPIGDSSKLIFSWQGLQPRGTLNLIDDLATQNIYSAAYSHSLSKRTDFYVWGSYGNNFQTFSTAKSSVIGTGMRHIF